MTRFYKVVLKDRVFWKESVRDYHAVYAEMHKKYGNSLKAVYIEDGVKCIDDLKKLYGRR